MASIIPETLPVPYLDPLEIEINQTIDRLIVSLNRRRFHLLTTLREKRNEVRARERARERMEQQLTSARVLLERQLTHNMLHSMQERLVEGLEAELLDLRMSAPKEIRFLCDSREFEERISHLGEIGHNEAFRVPPIPNYATFLYPIVAVGKKGSAPGEFNSPRGVSVQKDTGHIYVVDSKNKRIQIFSDLGEYYNQLGSHHLISPWGILVYQDNIFITDTEHNAVFQYTLPNLCFKTRVGKKGSGNDEFKNPRQLSTSPNQLIYVADQDNDRIQILDCTLVFRGSLQHQTMTSPVDIKFSANQTFVLSYWDNPCVHIFALTGEKIRSIIHRGAQVNSAYFFCLDAHINIIVNDRLANRVKVFSQKGDLLHSVGREGHEPGMFYNNRGIALLRDDKLVCVSNNNNFALQIFSS